MSGTAEALEEALEKAGEGAGEEAAVRLASGGGVTKNLLRDADDKGVKDTLKKPCESARRSTDRHGDAIRRRVRRPLAASKSCGYPCAAASLAGADGCTICSSVGSADASQPPPSALINATLAAIRRRAIDTASRSLVSAVVCATTTSR